MKKYIAFLLSLTCILAAVCGCGQHTPTWQEQYDLGVRYLSEGKYEEAVIAFTAAIEIDPKQADAYLGRGDANMALRATEGNDGELLRQAVDDYLEAIGLDPSLDDAYTRLSEAYVALGDVQKAIGILQEGFARTGEPSFSTGEEDLRSLYESVDIGIERQDITYTSARTGLRTQMHYDLVTVKGYSRQIRKINKAIRADFERFQTAGDSDPDTIDWFDSIGVRHEWMSLYLNDEFGDDDESRAFFMPCEVTASVAYNANGILSIRYLAHYIYDYSCEYGMTFDLATGEMLTCTELFRRDRAAVKAAVRSGLQEISDEFLGTQKNIEDALAESFDMDRLDYYIDDGELVVCSPRLISGDGTVRTSRIPCGVFIDEWDIPGWEPAVVHIEEKDHSILNPDGSVSIDLGYGLPIVEGNTRAIKRINSVSEELYNAYVQQLDRENFAEYAVNKPYPDDQYLYSIGTGVLYNKNNILCISHGMAWYMGGVFNNGFSGEVFDLKTGNQLGLRDLFYRDDDALLAMIQDKIRDYVAQIGDYYLYSVESTISGYTLENLEFIISEDGELIICIPEYELASGAAGALQIPCGLYLGKD